MDILILYTSRKGSTAEVAEFIAEQLQAADMNTTLANAADFKGAVTGYDAILLGSPMYKGMWLYPLLHTIRRNAKDFGDTPVWCWSLCVRVLEPDGEAYARLNYIPTDILKKLNLQDYQFFAGRLLNVSHPERTTLDDHYDGHFLFEHFGDHRDWDSIKTWVERIVAALQADD